ncbi:MAG: DNA topoisomerase III [Clostridia bacterium]|nr:DNA topoisomerase III [Clostridia bacterium]
MGKILVLAEKPSVGKELARVLGCRSSANGYISGAKYVVTWSLGHLVTLADPEYYDNKYKKWELETLPMIPKKMETVVIKETAKQYKVVQTLMKSPDISELVIATDAGREGELVARWIIERARFRKPIKRLWISSQTDKAIREGFAALKNASEYDNLYHSALCRAEADWLVGLNVTRALTCKYNAQLSAGRVQTPTLAMIAEREREIKAFKPKPFWELRADLESFAAVFRDKNNQSRILDKAKAEELLTRLNGLSARIESVTKEKKRVPPPLLYDLTELQRDANRKYAFSAKQTLNIMQRLYEFHKLLTYPRTDSRYLSADIVPTLAERLKSIAVGPYRTQAAEILRDAIKPTKRFVDDTKVSDHHAIIPTEQYVDFSVLSSEERKVYDLVVRRFLAALKSDFIYEQTTLKILIGKETFFAKGKIVSSLGWKSTGSDESEDDAEDEADQTLPQVKQGDSLSVKRLELRESKTKPPSRYTEATLLSAMEHPGKFIEDSTMRSVVDKTGGIGTPATRADIIEKLFSASYVERRGKEIFPLSKGMQVVDIVPADLKSPLLTAQWEKALDEISRGKSDRTAFMKKMEKYASALVSEVIASDAVYRHDNLTKNRCPECGNFLLEVNGKKGKMLRCVNRECTYRQSLAAVTNARCPNCHKKLSVSGEGEKKLYSCSCGFRERFEAFNKRLSESRGASNKRDVAEYMQKQRSEAEKAPSAFAQALMEAQKRVEEER